MVIHNPPHPGEVIRELCMKPLGLTVPEAAKGLGVSKKTLSALLMPVLEYHRKWLSGFLRPLVVVPKAADPADAI